MTMYHISVCIGSNTVRQKSNYHDDIYNAVWLYLTESHWRGYSNKKAGGAGAGRAPYF